MTYRHLHRYYRSYDWYRYVWSSYPHYVYVHWIFYPAIGYSNGYYDLDGYPYYVYNGYRNRYSTQDYCNYQLVDSFDHTVVQTYWNQTCNRGYDNCSYERDRMNEREHQNRYFCSETYRNQGYDYASPSYEDSHYGNYGDVLCSDMNQDGQCDEDADQVDVYLSLMTGREVKLFEQNGQFFAQYKFGHQESPAAPLLTQENASVFTAQGLTFRLETSTEGCFALNWGTEEQDEVCWVGGEPLAMETTQYRSASGRTVVFSEPGGVLSAQLLSPEIGPGVHAPAPILMVGGRATFTQGGQRLQVQEAETPECLILTWGTGEHDRICKNLI